MRTSHTTKQGKAKCLSYRNGKRCGRIAKHVITAKRGVSGIRWQRMAVCDECRQEWVEDRGAALDEASSTKGFITTNHESSGWIAREYAPIGA